MLLEEVFEPAMLSLENFRLTENRAENLRLIEIERRSTEEPPPLNLHLDRLRSSRNVEDLLNTCAEVLEEIAGFDRVMIYKFHDDNHGEVVAEQGKRGR